MTRENLRKIGQEYEEKAADYLKKQGYQIVERNFHCKMGEIDLIARENTGYLVFVEVKYRRSSAMGWPTEAVNWKKQQRISKTAAYYLLTREGTYQCPCRFDVIEFVGEQLHHIQNAFDYLGGR